MARIRVSGASGSSENTIVFIPSGGHSHDGVTSSLISTEKYSIYDFSPSFVNSNQSQTRAVRQENNRLAFESLVVSIVNQSVLVPAGIRLDPGSLNGSTLIANTVTAVHIAANTITADEISANTITADQIASNTITADELVSNVVLVNNIIRSNNYTAGTGGTGGVGWKISNDGSAEFSNVVVRGNIYSNVGTIGGWTLSGTSLASGTGSTTLYSNGAAVIGNTTIAANGRITNGNFSVSNTGVLTATGADISGVITSTSGTIGGWSIGSSSIFKTVGSLTSIISSASSAITLLDTAGGGNNITTISPGFASFAGGGNTTTIQSDRVSSDLFVGDLDGDAGSVNGVVVGSSFGQIVTRSAGDGAISTGGYFVFTGNVTIGSGVGDAIRRRSDGYILTVASRRKYKSDISYPDKYLNIVSGLKPAKFKYNKQTNYVNENLNMQEYEERHQYGFIVEEVAEVEPLLVKYNDDEDYQNPTPMMWDDIAMVSVSIGAIKELFEYTKSLEKRLSALEQR